MAYNTIKVNPISVILICLSMLVSCTSKDSYWDEGNSTYVLPSLQLSIHLPQNDNWAIAEVENLPENILFFGIIPDDGIGLYLFSEKDIKFSSVRDLSHDEIQQQVYPIFRQPSLGSEKINYGALETEICKFLGEDAIKFQINMNIDEMGVKFVGYLFVHDNQLLKYVMSQPYPSTSKSAEQFKDILENSIIKL